MKAEPHPIKSPAEPQEDQASSSGSTFWIAPLAALVAIAACMLNGRSVLSLALITLFTGICLTVAPPLCRLPRFLLACALLILLAASVSLLPVSWFGALPEWRRSLIGNWNFQLPDTLSPQPALTLGSLLTLITASFWFVLILGSRMRETSRRQTLRLLTFGIYVIAALALIQRFGWINLNWPLGFPQSGLDLGPFANRNHFASLCAIGCVLGAGLAHDAYRQKSRYFLLFAAGILIPFTAIVINTSRGGLLLFFIGLTLWLTTGSVRSGFFRTLAVTASLILGGAAVLIVFGGGAGAKLIEQGLNQQGIGGRLPVYEQTFALIGNSPFVGIGLGNFDGIFSLTHSLPTPTSRIIHPESDWLWWWSEIGLFGIIPIILGFFWILILGFPHSRSGKHNHHQTHDRRLRGIACICLILPILHGLTDVPLHNAGFAAVVLLLGACAIPPRKLKFESHLASRFAFRTVGLSLVALGAAHALTLTGKPIIIINQPSSKLRFDNITKLASSGKHSEALEACNLAIQQTPLDFTLHYQRGFLRLQLRQLSSEALTDFNRARVLEPNNLSICQQEAELWLKFDPPLAIIPWRSLLQRTQNTWFYASMLALSQSHPELATSVRQLATSPSMLASILFTAQPGPPWDSALSNLLNIDPSLAQIDLQQRNQVLATWQQRGNRDQLLSILETHPDWHSESWPLLAEEYARLTEFEKAWNLQRLHAYATSPQKISTGALFENLERNFALKPTDARLGVDLYFAQKKRGLLEDATRTLERLLSLPDPPPFLNFEKAALFAERKDFRRAYETMKNALAAKPKA